MAITIDTETFTWRGRALARTYIGQDKCSWASGDLDRDGKPSSHTDVTLFVTCWAPRTWSAQLWVPRTERGYYIVHSSDENLEGGHPGDCDTAEGCMARVDGEAQKFAAFLVGGVYSDDASKKKIEELQVALERCRKAAHSAYYSTLKLSQVAREVHTEADHHWKQEFHR